MSRFLDLAGSLLPYSLKPWEWCEEKWTSQDVPDLSGKVALITGANGGVGKETSFELFRHGAHVLMGCRSKTKFEAAASSIRSRLRPDDQPGELTFLLADTSTIRTSQLAAQSVLENKAIERLDVFVANAGRGSKRGPLNEDGVEPFMATNCVGHLALLRALLPILITTSRRQSNSPGSCRIVFVSSVAEHWCSMPWPFARPPTFESWDDVNDDRRGEQALYAASKLAQILTIRKLNWELAGENISCLAIHPGELNNAFVQNMIPAPLFPHLRWLLQIFLLDEREGARTCLFAATAKEIDERSWRGIFITYPARMKEPSSRATDMTLADRIWSLQIDLIDRHTKKAS